VFTGVYLTILVQFPSCLPKSLSTDIICRTKQKSNPTYDDLLEENRQLKAELEGDNVTPSRQVDIAYSEVLNITESFERDLFGAVNGTGRISTVFRDDQVHWPSATCVTNLLSYGKTWTSWIHCALHHPTFESECWKFLDTSGKDAVSDPLWLAVYFSFMSVSQPSLHLTYPADRS
jgi:hypothetical protein